MIIIKQYYTKIQPLKCNQTDYNSIINLNIESAKVWNSCIKLDNIYKNKTKKHITRWDLQKELKGKFNLHSKNIQHVIKKYSQNISDAYASIKAKHENSYKVNLPYKLKNYYTTGWDNQSVKRFGNFILLPKPIKIINGKNKLQKPYKCYVKNPPENIVEVELIYRGNSYYLAIKYKKEKEYLQIQSKNEASIDLGEIHSITSIDNNGNALIITGRQLRSIKRLRNKHLGKLRSKMDKCKKYSNQWNKYNKAIRNLSWKFSNKIIDATHKISNLYVNYCIENNVSVVYYGDLDSCTRNTKKRMGKKVGQKLNQWNYGQLICILKNKFNKHNIKLVKVKEYYTSKKCPKCEQLNNPNGRVYICNNCEYTMHRDINGAINIFNDNSNYKIIKYENMKYLRIA